MQRTCSNPPAIPKINPQYWKTDLIHQLEDFGLNPIHWKIKGSVNLDFNNSTSILIQSKKDNSTMFKGYAKMKSTNGKMKFEWVEIAVYPTI